MRTRGSALKSPLGGSKLEATRIVAQRLRLRFRKSLDPALNRKGAVSAPIINFALPVCLNDAIA